MLFNKFFKHDTFHITLSKIVIRNYKTSKKINIGKLITKNKIKNHEKHSIEDIELLLHEKHHDVLESHPTIKNVNKIIDVNYLPVFKKNENQFNILNKIVLHFGEINNLLEDFKRILQELEKEEVKNEKTEKYCNDIHFINERIKTAKDAYFIEIRNLSEEEQIENISKIKNKMIILENLNIQFDFKKSKLIYEEDKQAKENKKLLKVRYVSAKDIETKGDIIQDQTDDAIFRMKMMVDESENITKDAADKLNIQNEKLQKARDKIEDVDINVYSAKQTLKEIAKEAVTDRFVRLMSILIFIVVSVLITVIIISRKQTPVVIHDVMTENEHIRKNKSVRRQEMSPKLT
ncbi:hypothetical protein PFNF54_00888 [Plasmodium falciparum NF54]|uniref:t-SNARE coiled-coil homology domain-containing protein n=2 Tax=Plasmodium falciparum TaxID=5833 RepID=W7K043_PLAFO|nr:hypothetical protein PFNF54_00888 [Plasmodium falciparum NF54]